ncbi:MAG: cupin domain-containing protein [Clostridiaceae bacterium]|nr:cupin domain-containing protein [Clostridiaceae bacterium]
MYDYNAFNYSQGNWPPMYDPYNYGPYNPYMNYNYSFNWPNQMPTRPMEPNRYIQLKDYGPAPLVINIEDATKQNSYYRTALWTGKYFQLTLMSINVGEDIGLEMHPDVDQFIRIEEGQGLAVMGDTKDNLNFQRRVSDDYIIIIPAGKWHNVINNGTKPLKLYSIYAPPEHPHGTVHRTRP